ncbi:hypothetical protein A6764_22220 [Brevibacillus sp. WF146]|uniref:hypothetical protein n=1 Tax=Brevibacillus sp. WF146 TaxID=319501 RepID=UPI0022277B6F|nr:hypothetical protein [Brevibacillus sp. WF146]UYZ13424.1 hypothetical protein A6764_22220 [Brevibacillus sp. WF146]
MAYEDQTKDVIHQRMLDASPPDIDKRPGSVTYDLTGPVAIEAEALYVELGTFTIRRSRTRRTTSGSIGARQRSD